MHRNPSTRYNRRVFLQSASAAAGAAVLAGPGILRAGSPTERVNLAGVGVGGKGWSDINSASVGHNVVAFCDVDTTGSGRRGGFGAAADKWPAARKYTDWREMLDKEHRNLDGITISTPDHMHAPVTMSAIQLGLATYTQKPMTRTIYEARQLTTAARKAGVVTQMGNQGHSGVAYRSIVQLIQDGAIGKIKEAHAWSNRPIWPQGIDRPTEVSPIPEGLSWDLWLGVAPERPFVKGAYHPFNWRGWYDFGAGALGDMGCHILDPVVWALELGPPSTVRYEGPPPKPETFPKWELIHYQFPGTKRTAGDTINVIWYDGGRLPSAELAQLDPEQKLPDNGTLFIGESGQLLTRHGGMPQLLPREKFQDYELPQLEEIDHYLQWTNAIRGEGHTTSSFDYAGPLTETVLLGTIASRTGGETLQWNSASMTFTNSELANQYVKPVYREGWHVAELA